MSINSKEVFSLTLVFCSKIFSNISSLIDLKDTDLTEDDIFNVFNLQSPTKCE